MPPLLSWRETSQANLKAFLIRPMNFPTEIPDLKADLHYVLGMCEADEKALAKSSTPEVDGIFLASLNKLRHELEARLRRAKAEGRHEVMPTGWPG